MNFLDVFSGLAAPVTQWVKNRGEVKKAKHERKLAVINNQSRLAQSEKEFNHDWEMASLEGNSQWLRVVCFVQLALPLNISVIWPEQGAAIWTNLNGVPEWFIQLYMIVVGSIWGISEFKKAAPHVIGSVVKMFKKEG